MDLSRRSFFLTAGGAGLAAAGLAGWRFGCDGDTPHRIERSARAFGTRVKLVAVDERPAVATSAIAAALSEVAAVERLMSLFRRDSELSRLNRDGRLADPHPKLVEILRGAQAMGQRTGGAFDVTVGPLWQLYRDAKIAGRLPDAGAIEAARANVDFSRMDVQPSAVRLGEGMAVTLNSIAQGYAADRALAAMRDRGVACALVDTGEVAPLGRRDDGAPWQAGIRHPRRSDALLGRTALDGRCLATSGDYATAFAEDLSAHHIFDPSTGRSPEQLAAVSVLAPSAASADALSTAIMVLGPGDGLRLLGNTSGCDALLVTKAGGVLRTAGFPAGGVA